MGNLVRICQQLRIENEKGPEKLKYELEQSTRFNKELIMLEAKHLSAAKESEETVKLLHEDISRRRSELESVRMKKKEQIVKCNVGTFHDPERSGLELGESERPQDSLCTEQEKSKVSSPFYRNR